MQIDAEAFDRQMSNIEKAHLPHAAAEALTETAWDVFKEMQRRMDVVFDRPSRFTKNALMVWRATPKNLEARVQERPSVTRRHFLKVQERGGPRPQTGLEKLLDARLAYDGIIQAVTPASGARLDAFGNWSIGERNQALSSLGAQRDANMNTTAASARRKKGRRASYFVPRNGGLYPAIWKRSSPQAKPEPVLNLVDKVPTYQRRLGFYDEADAIWQKNMPGNLRRALDAAVAAAK